LLQGNEFLNNRFEIYCGDCLKILPTLAENSIDAVVTDPPYGISFMGKKWDHGVPGQQFWKEIFRVAKPGAHLFSFGGTKSFHRLACAIEDAGWEMRDTIGVPHESGYWGDCPWLFGWTYGSGFPKSLDIGKAINQDSKDSNNKWENWGTALKPAWEPIILARKPISHGTIVKNIQQYGTGGLNIGKCRIETEEIIKNHSRSIDSSVSKGIYGNSKYQETHQTSGQLLGRYPSNLIHDGSGEVINLFPKSDTNRIEKTSNCSTDGVTSFDSMRGNRPARGYTEKGSAARFFYCAKASPSDRDEGLEDFEEKKMKFSDEAQIHGTGNDNGINRIITRKNIHPTVKPIKLMRYLCRLITQPDGIVLDPFMGSGSTGKAAMLEEFRFIGIDMDKRYCEIARARLEDAENKSKISTETKEKSNQSYKNKINEEDIDWIK
jgi:site-specific DNA-methyltransferase (adenine-specific)